jgi:phage N-6-adenine-methyltransferase
MADVNATFEPQSPAEQNSMKEFHPAANIFRLLAGEDFAKLVNSVRTCGLIEPIWLDEQGRILDGRNRYRACLEAGVEPHFRQWDGNGLAADFVWALNADRRHDTDGERQMAAGRYAIERESEARERSGIRTDLGTSSPIGNEVEFGRSVEKAADKFGISERAVSRAVAVVKKGTPELVSAVEEGKVSVSAAAELATLPKEEQREIVEAGPVAVREAAKEIRNTGHVNRTSFTGENEWFTPAEWLDRARAALGEIDLDPASNPLAQEAVKATAFFTKEDDALTKEWGGRVWMNPPYAQPLIGQFAEKLLAEIDAGRVTQALTLTHNYTDTGWFHALASRADAICFTRGRIRFVSPAGELAAPTQGQALMWFGPNRERFMQAFNGAGIVMVKP